MRLVDTDELAWFNIPYGYEGNIAVVLKRDIDSAPTIDAAPIRHGYWIDNGYKKHCPQFIKGKLVDAPARMFNCSECGMTSFHMRRPYCAYCGARMDREGSSNE